MCGKADAAAHDDAVDERDIGLRIALDAAVEDVFLAPEGELGGVIAGPALFVEKADVAARAKGAPARAGHDHADDAIIFLELIERRGDRANHPEVERVQRLWPIERD